MDEKRVQTPASPADTISTLRGDAFIEIGEVHAPNPEKSLDEARPSSPGEAAQPGR